MSKEGNQHRSLDMLRGSLFDDKGTVQGKLTGIIILLCYSKG